MNAGVKALGSGHARPKKPPVAPAAAYAAVSLVGIVGSNGKRAQVTGANQLQTAEATPSQFRAINFFVVGSSGCDTIFTAPSTKGFVLKQALFDVWANPTPGAGEFVAIYGEPTCSNPVALINPESVNGYVVPFEPGFAVKSGSSLYGTTGGSVAADLYLLGYLVPKSAVPATTSVARVPHTASRAGSPGGS